MHYLCREKYRLEVHWDKVNYHNDAVANLEGVYLSGPVLKDAVKLESPDHIDLDLTPQLLTVLNSYYLVRLSWAGVKYNPDGTITLEGAVLSNDYLKSLHKIEDKDYILINTEKHEETTHAYNLVYESQIMRADKEPHNYRSK